MRLSAPIPILLLPLLLVLGCWRCSNPHGIHATRERTLRQNLFHLRQSIDQYTIDKQQSPQKLDDLVKAGYLREIPIDPFTRRSDTWIVEKESVTLAVGTQPGITDVRSSSPETGCDGTNYNTW